MSDDYDAVAEAAARKFLPPPRDRKAIREAAGLSRLKIADHMGVSSTAVSYWESEFGRHSEPRGENLLKYIELLRDLDRLSEDV